MNLPRLKNRQSALSGLESRECQTHSFASIRWRAADSPQGEGCMHWLTGRLFKPSFQGVRS
jgi:hypothetical protein